MTHHILPIRVYYEDTDAGGVVYHANYLKFAERGRTEFLRTLGYQNSDLEKNLGILFVVRHIDIEYLKPGRLDDALELHTSILDLKNSSFVMKQSVFRGKEMIADLKVAIVCVDRNVFRPVRIPADVLEGFQTYRE